MIEIDVYRFKKPPFAHQVVGIKKLVTDRVVAVFDEMGAGKSYQLVNAACVLYEAGEIDTVVVEAPASVKTVWQDEDLGQISQYCWVGATVLRYDGESAPRFDRKRVDAPKENGLVWIVVSYELTRQDEYLKRLQRWLRGRRYWLVCDESLFVKNWKAKQTKAALELRDGALRCAIANGTPGDPIELYSQFKLLDPRIIGSKNFYAFRNRYCKLGGYQSKQVVGFQNLEELNRKLAPYILRRLKADCLDLPPKLFTQIEAPLKPESWRIYKEMRDDLVSYLRPGSMALASVASVRALRLAQITSGFVGGVMDEPVTVVDEGLPQYERGYDPATHTAPIASPPREIGTEKMEAVIQWLVDHPGAQRVIVWCRFRAEIDRFYDWARSAGSGFSAWKIYKMYGGQSARDRQAVKEEGEIGTGRCLIFANTHAGGLGLTMATINTVIYSSNDYSLPARLQSEDRCHRPGQRSPVMYVDVIATGPTGQKTIDHLVIKKLRQKDDLAKWTTEQWRQAIAEEVW